MNAPGMAAVLASGLLGCLVLTAIGREQGRWRQEWPLLTALGVLLGFGLSSCAFLVATLVSNRPLPLACGIEAGLGIVALIVCRRRTPALPGPPAKPWTTLEWLVAGVVVQLAVAAAVVMWRAYRAEPYGGWDAWAIWNLHARFLVRGGPDWPELLASPSLNWTHPDYPWLVSASVARAWAWAGREMPGLSALIATSFSLTTAGILMSVTLQRRGALVALISVAALLGTPFFLTFAPNQHADIPLGACLLASVACWLRGEGGGGQRARLLAGMFAGLAAWTKNEGLLFVVVFAGLIAVHSWRRREAAFGGWFGAGLLVALGPTIAFKLFLAPANDLVSGATLGRLAQLFDLDRHGLILAALWRDIRGFGEWQVAPWVALALPWVLWRARRKLTAAERLVPAVIAGMVLGYYGVYLTSPQDLAGHLDSSLVRLLLQLWPLGLLWWALTVPAPEFAETGRLRMRSPILWLAVNVAAAGVLWWTTSGQRAVDELAVRRAGLGVVGVALGPGWFGVEQQGRNVWAWSGGDAALLVRGTTEATQRRVVRADLRSLGARVITVRQGGEIIWQRAVGDEFVTIELPVVMADGGGVALQFTSDQPPIPESADANARKLAFALYNVRLE